MSRVVDVSPVPTRVMLTGVHFHDRSLGWIVGHDATILRSENDARWSQHLKLERLLRTTLHRRW